jgi:hypothetical protein
MGSCELETVRTNIEKIGGLATWLAPEEIERIGDRVTIAVLTARMHWAAQRHTAREVPAAKWGVFSLSWPVSAQDGTDWFPQVRKLNWWFC